MKRTSTCTICGQPAPRGAPLCAPCRAALKRAGQRTVQELPHYRHPVPRARAPRPTVPNAERSGAAMPRRTRRRSGDTGRRVVLATAAVAALAGVAYLGQPQWSPGDDDDAPGDARTRPAQASPTPRPPPADGVPLSVTAPAAPASSAPMAPSAPARPTARASPSAAPRAGAPPARVEPPPPAYPSLDAFGAIAEAPRAPPPLPVAAARPAPPPDRWQRMRDALVQCEREGGFSGFLCDQRTRIDACEGYWGRVPQCPDMPENPR